jgi:hypothetical protein
MPDGAAEPAFAAPHARNLDLNCSRFRATIMADHGKAHMGLGSEGENASWQA